MPHLISKALSVLLLALPSTGALAAARLQDSQPRPAAAKREEVLSEPAQPTAPNAARAGGIACGTLGPGFEQWRFWWQNNKDQYLERPIEKSALGSQASIERPSWDEIRNRILPVLKEALTDDDADVVDAAVLALGRITPVDQSALVLEDVEKVVGNINELPQQSAVLSLGVLGSTEAIPLLTEVMNDSAEGRGLTHSSGEIHELQRSFAAISLGRISAEESVPSLIAVLHRANSGSTGFRASVVLALGSFREGRNQIVAELTALLNDPSLDPTIRAQAPISLARLGPRAATAIPRLLQLLLANDTEKRVRQSTAIALGVLAQPSHPGVVAGLKETIESCEDDQTRHFAMIALSDIAVHAAAIPDAIAVDDVTSFLARELHGGSHAPKTTHRPWAALSLARIGRALDPASLQRAAITTSLSRAFDDENDPSYLGAIAIGLALVDARTAGTKILEALNRTNGGVLRGQCAVALGLLRHVEAKPALHALLLDDRAPTIRPQVAAALALAGDAEAVPLLIDALRDAKTLGEFSSISKSLAVLGDRRAIEPLASLVRDANMPGLARAYACVALGRIAEKTKPRWNEPLLRNANYRTVVGAQYEILDIL